MSDEYTTTPVGNALHIPGGLVAGAIDVCAVDNREYADLDRYVQLTITNVTGNTFDSHAATISVVDNDVPDVRVFALPVRLARPSPREGTNIGSFFFIRDGDSLTACTISFSIAGTAKSGVDYNPLPTTITFRPNERTNSLPLVPKFSRDVTEKTVILTITNTPNYQIDPANSRATTILETLL